MLKNGVRVVLSILGFASILAIIIRLLISYLFIGPTENIIINTNAHGEYWIELFALAYAVAFCIYLIYCLVKRES